MINILFSGNGKVLDGALLTMLSAIKRTEGEAFTFYVFTMNLTRLSEKYTPISDDDVAFLDRAVKGYNKENSVKKIDVTDLYEKEFAYCPNEGAYCSPYTLLRLLADLVPNMPDKLLYLDIDVMFNKSAKLLFDTDIEGYEYAATTDHYGKFLIRPDYINAGVILFNLKECKKTGLFIKAREELKKRKLLFADQDAIFYSTTKKKMLSQRFNDQKFLYKGTVIRHFSKRLFYLPYPHSENIKQWQVEKVKKVFGYTEFDDIYKDYYLIKEGVTNE